MKTLYLPTHTKFPFYDLNKNQAKKEKKNIPEPEHVLKHMNIHFTSCRRQTYFQRENKNSQHFKTTPTEKANTVLPSRRPNATGVQQRWEGEVVWPRGGAEDMARLMRSLSDPHLVMRTKDEVETK